MDCFITYCIKGFIAIDENEEIIDSKLFKNDEILSKINKIENKEILKEEIELIEKISENYDTIYIETNKRLSIYSDLNCFKKIKIQNPNKGGEFLRNNLKKLSFYNKEEFSKNYRKIALYKMKEASKSEDKHLIQASNSIDEIDETISKLIERIREWYALYFPEMDLINNNETYIKLIHENKTKKEIINQNPDLFIADIDSDINKEDLEILHNFATSIYTLQKTRKKTEEYIDIKMEKIAPNLKHLLGSTIAAKLIVHAGGLKRLATYSSSTVQIMGAEKALFRHLKSGDRPPKHGIIYQHPQVRSNKWWIRGKIARLLASKISLAARKDVFTNEFDSSILDDFLEKVEKIKKENPFPTKTTKKRKEEKKKGKKSRKKKRKRKK